MDAWQAARFQNDPSLSAFCLAKTCLMWVRLLNIHLLDLYSSFGIDLTAHA